VGRLRTGGQVRARGGSFPFQDWALGSVLCLQLFFLCSQTAEKKREVGFLSVGQESTRKRFRIVEFFPVVSFFLFSALVNKWAVFGRVRGG
jgi:hypothetical protein